MPEGKPWAVYIYELFNSVMPLADWALITKAISTVVLSSIFYYHAMHSITKEFRTNYPNLFARLDLKHYNKVKWAFLLIPFADIFFYYLIIKNRYTTVAFLKAFAVKPPTKPR